MVKSYLKYEHSTTFGVICSPSANVLWSPDQKISTSQAKGTAAGRAIVGANEEAFCWDIKKGELLSRWRDPAAKSQVTVITRSNVDGDIYAVGYADGSIRLWDAKIATVIVNFNGHRSAVTALEFDSSGTRLASGAKDTDIIIWDLVAEVGLFKLRGHKDQITGIHFIQTNSQSEIESEDVDRAPAQELPDKQEDYLLTTGKDALIKIWDITSQHCIETHVAQSNGECWALGVSPEDSGCITAGNDGELKVWSLDLAGLYEASRHVELPERKYLHDRGTLYRQGRDRPLGVHFHSRADYFAVHGSEKAIEIWRIRPEGEIQKVLARKRKRRREKLQAMKQDPLDKESEILETEAISSASISEIFVPYVIVRTGGRLNSMHWTTSTRGKAIQLLAATANNLLEMYNIPVKREKAKSDEPPEYLRISSVDLQGHRTDIRALALSSDDRMLASASSGSLKVWNVRSQACIRTFDCGYALCCSFLPGDKVVVVGTKSGDLELFDVASSTLIDTVKAHEGSVWTLQVHPDGKSLASAGADKSAKLWNFEIVQEEIPGTKRTTPRLRLLHTRTLKVSDDILSLRFSPDSRLLAVALLDNTVKVFFTDSLKLFLNLYGHKLPVLNMDISYDSKLIVTCSADKNVRIWGLDFGDCHKAIFAHQDSIMQVRFIPHHQDGNGHHFFSASKDRLIKYWDGDKFEQIQRLGGHHGEIWALAISRTGDFVVSASHDKSIRVWDQTDEQIFLEEEREKEMEELYESTLTTSLEQEDAEQGEVAAAGKQTVSTLMAGEKIVEALELGMEDLETMRVYRQAKASTPSIAPPARHPLFIALGNITAEEHVLSVIQKIPAAALQDALLVLPFSIVPSLFCFLNLFAERGLNIPLTCRVLFFMLKTHHPQLVASRGMKAMLERVRASLRHSLETQKDMVGFNLAALRVVGSRIEEAGMTRFIDGAEDKDDAVGRGKKKRAFVDVA